MTSPVGPLDGYLVLDFTHILAGPYCTQLLADAGATVIKVEPPGGEYSRLREPDRTDGHGNGVNAFSAAVNRHKRDICLDLKNPAGFRIAEQLIALADVLIENFAPGAFDRAGLSLKRLREARPELVTCSISLFGGLESAGEHARRGGLAIIAEAESGVGGLQRRADGSPMGLGFPLGDMGSGMAAYGAIVTALLVRERTGVGQHIDISMVKALLSLNSLAVMREELNPRSQADLVAFRTAAYGNFPAADGFVAIGVSNDRLFHRLLAVIGQDWMITDQRFAHRPISKPHVDEVNGLITEWTSARAASEVIAALSPLGIPCGLVATARDILDSQMFAELGFLEEVGDGLGGLLHVPANPLGYTQPDPVIPLLNEHCAEVMADLLGIEGEGYEQLRKEGAFGPALSRSLETPSPQGTRSGYRTFDKG